MAYPTHALLAWGGTLHGVEQHVTTMRLVGNAGSELGDDEAQAFMANLEPALRTYITGGGFHSGYRVTWMKLNNIGPDGKYVSKTNTNRRDFVTVMNGGSTSGHPAQIALACTLTTTAQRGLASKGRFYQGGLGLSGYTPATADGLISATQAADFGNRCKTLLEAINNNPGLDANFGGYDVHIVSDGGLSGVGVARKVTGIKVGRVLDTQRRRRGSLVENYSPVVAVN
jgi:hypothetical protein